MKRKLLSAYCFCGTNCEEFKVGAEWGGGQLTSALTVFNVLFCFVVNS